MGNINLVDAFVKIELKTQNNNSYYSQGLIFRDSDQFGVITPVLKELADDSLITLITINSGTYPREFEFSIRKEMNIIKNAYLMYIPLDEISWSNCSITHINRTYPKAELSSIRYCMKKHFSESIITNEEESYFCSFLNNELDFPIKNNVYNFLYPANQEIPDNPNYAYAAIHDAILYNGSPYIIHQNPKESNFQMIQGIFIANPECISKLKNTTNTGLIIFSKMILEFIENL